MAGVTGLEPAASGVTGRRSNQLSYTPFAVLCLLVCQAVLKQPDCLKTRLCNAAPVGRQALCGHFCEKNLTLNDLLPFENDFSAFAGAFSAPAKLAVHTCGTIKGAPISRSALHVLPLFWRIRHMHGHMA